MNGKIRGIQGTDKLLSDFKIQETLIRILKNNKR